MGSLRSKLIAAVAVVAFAVVSMAQVTTISAPRIFASLLVNAPTGVQVKFGGTTSSFPGLKRNATGIDFRLADDSAYAQITASRVILAGGGGGLVTGSSMLINAASPSIASGFGTSPSIVASNGAGAFTLNVGTGGAATSGVITIGSTATTGWNCFAIDRTTNVVTRETATSTTTATLTAASAWTASDILQVSCFGY